MKRPKRRPGIEGNTHHTMCDRCGIAYNAEQTLIEQRSGLLVCTWCYDAPHPLDTPPNISESDFPDPEHIRPGDSNQ